MEKKTTLLILLGIILIIASTIIAKDNSVRSVNTKGIIGKNVLTNSYAGRWPMREGGNLFWWFIQTDEGIDKPLVIWLNGGPGCSSMVGATNENGPIRWNDKTNEFEENEQSWHKEVNMLYIDNPIGTGFSEEGGSIPTSATEAMNQLYEGLKIWTGQEMEGGDGAGKMFQNQDTYIFGESYGGKYVLALANIIKNDKETKFKNLKGIGLGNSWVSPELQSKDYAETGYQTGVLNVRQLQDTRTAFDTCLKETDEQHENDKNIPPLTTCLKAWSHFIKGKDEDNEEITFTNGYDYRKHKSYDWLLKNEFSNEMKNKVAEALLGGYPYPDFAICNNAIFKAMGNDFQESYVNIVPTLLNQNIHILVYNGQFDMRANVAGTNAWLNYVNWDGKGAFASAPKSVFKIKEGEKSITKGLYRHYKNLHQLVVYNSGHMVPMDQPIASLEMIKRFTSQNNLCTDNNCEKPTCPMQCSAHNLKKPCSEKQQTCECDLNFKGDACEIYEDTNFLAGETLSLTKSYLPGHFTHTYNLQIPKSGDENLDIHIDLERVADKEGVNGGRAYIFLYAGDKFQEVEPTIALMQRKFPFHTLSGEIKSNLYANELKRSEVSNVTVVIWNDSPHSALYNIMIHPKTSGKKLNPLNVVSYVTFGLTAAFTLALTAIFVSQYCFSKALYSFSNRRK